jgi:hypothetical protein
MLVATSQKPRTRDTMMMTWSVWALIQCRDRARKRGGGDQAEQRERQVVLPGGQLRLDDDCDAGGDESPGLGQGAERHGVPRCHVVDVGLPSGGLFRRFRLAQFPVVADRDDQQPGADGELGGERGQ